MEIILLQDIEKVGDKHTIINVKNGYGRNYLIPKGMALIANRTNRRRLADLQRREDAMNLKMLDQYEVVADKLKGAHLKIGAKAGTSGKIFGSVTTIQLAAALKDQYGVDVERKRIILPEDVKTLGEYEATLNLHPKVQPVIKFEVVEDK